MSADYRKIVSTQIRQIVSNITISGNDLLDASATPQRILIAIQSFKLRGFDLSVGEEFKEILLANWIYCRYYQNRDPISVADIGKVNERHFPFRHMSKEGTDAYWRNRFWRYDSKMESRDRVVLTRGHESVYAVPQQFVEDDFVFETSENSTETLFNEVPYLSMVRPKFDIGDEQKYAFGKYPLDDDGQGGIIRFYFHLDTECLSLSIPFLLTKITTLFNARLIPFQIKFLSNAEDYIRADHFILYVERRHFFIAGLLLNDIYEDIKDYLDDRRLPFFVRETRRGIGFAKGPDRNAGSFGFLRSMDIAKAILKKLGDNTVKPVFDYLDFTWGGIENFHLNPHPSFNYDFAIFQTQDVKLFEDVKVDNTMSAAWYIARLLCREAIWIGEGLCNWLSYHRFSEVSYGYRLLAVDNGEDGLEGVILFLRSFKAIGIHDTIVEHVLAGAEQFFTAQNGQNRIGTPRPPQSPTNTSRINRIKMKPEGFAKKELGVELQKVITGEKFPRPSELMLLQSIMVDYIQIERPVGNRLDGSDHFCASLKHGLAGFGYAYLRQYDQFRVARLQEIQF